MLFRLMACVECSDPRIAPPARLWLQKRGASDLLSLALRIILLIFRAPRSFKQLFKSFRRVELRRQGRPETQRLAHAHVVAP